MTSSLNRSAQAGMGSGVEGRVPTAPGYSAEPAPSGRGPSGEHPSRGPAGGGLLQRMSYASGSEDEGGDCSCHVAGGSDAWQMHDMLCAFRLIREAGDALAAAHEVNRDLHRRAQKAESFRQRHGRGVNYLLNRRLEDRRARRAAEADRGRLASTLAFYAESENYETTGWQGDQDPPLVVTDRGRKARAALASGTEVND